MAEQRSPEGSTGIRRDVDLELPAEEVWDLVADGERWSDWLAPVVDVRVEPGAGGRVVDDDGVVRRVAVDDVVPGRSVHFRWWPEDGGGPASAVELRVIARPSGSRLRVVEVLALASAGGTVRASADWSTALARLDERPSVALVGC
jgi:uncharacterized protein YndB with AHSA1/START domain